MKKHTIIIATLSALTAQIIFGFSFMFTKIALGYSSPMTVIFDRYLVAFIAMTVVMVVTKQKINIQKGMWKIVLMSFFQPTLYFLFETYGIKLTSSAFSSVMIALIPIASMVCGIFTLGEIPRPMQYVFSLLSISGVVVITMSASSTGTVTPFGVVLLAGAVFSSCAFNITSRKISGEFTVMQRTYATTVIGLISFALISFFENIGNPGAMFTSFAKPDFLWAIVYLGVASSVGAFFFMNYANTYLPVARTTVFANITTVISVAASAVFLKEPITPTMIVATLVIIAGVTGVQIVGIRNSRESK